MVKDGYKEIKVKIPIEYHIKLHSIRLTEDRSLSSTVQDALETYFQVLKRQAQQEDDPREQVEIEQYAE